MEQSNNSAIAEHGTKQASELLKDYLASVNAGNPKATASFFAEDAYIDAPYVEALGMPAKIVGTTAIEATMQGLLQLAPNFHFTSTTIILETPTEVVAEYESEATFTNGRQYKQLYICHLTTKNGKIISHREFLNTIPFAAVFFPNGLNDLITSK